MIPSAQPRRYKTRDGYVLLRWKVGPREYVEALEHRVQDGQVVTAENMHHINGDRTDNRPENLQSLTASAHSIEHHEIDRAEVARLYQSGLSTTEVAERVGTFPGNVSRMLAQVGVPARSTRRWTDEQEGQIAADLRRLGTSGLVLALWPMSRSTLSRIAREHGVRSKPGRRAIVTAG